MPRHHASRYHHKAELNLKATLTCLDPLGCRGRIKCQSSTDGVHLAFAKASQSHHASAQYAPPGAPSAVRLSTVHMQQRRFPNLNPSPSRHTDRRPFLTFVRPCVWLSPRHHASASKAICHPPVLRSSKPSLEPANGASVGGDSRVSIDTYHLPPPFERPERLGKASLITNRRAAAFSGRHIDENEPLGARGATPALFVTPRTAQRLS